MNATVRILVVEDEPLVAMMAVEALSDAGFAAEEIGTAAEALARLSDNSLRMDAVILDMRLPDRSGDELACELHTIRPELPIVIASGYDVSAIERRFANNPRIAVLGKPYLSSDLRDALFRVGVSATSG